MGDRDERVAHNQTLFRELNERLREITETIAPGDAGALELFCECGRADCMEKIHVPALAYEAVRARAELFVVAPAHDVETVERVLERADGYWIVEKHEEEAQTARDTDPRGRG